MPDFTKNIEVNFECKGKQGMYRKDLIMFQGDEDLSLHDIFGTLGEVIEKSSYAFLERKIKLWDFV